MNIIFIKNFKINSGKFFINFYNGHIGLLLVIFYDKFTDSLLWEYLTI